MDGAITIILRVLLGTHSLSHYFAKIPMSMFLSGCLFVFRAYVWTHTHKYYGDELPWSFLSCPSEPWLGCTVLHRHFPLTHASNFQPTPFSVSESGEGPRKRSVRHSHKTKRRKFWWLIRAPWLHENSSSFRYSLSTFSPKHIKSVRIKAFLVFVLLLFCYFPAFPYSFCVFLNYVSLKQCLCEAVWLVSFFLAHNHHSYCCWFPFGHCCFWINKTGQKRLSTILTYCKWRWAHPPVWALCTAAHHLLIFPKSVHFQTVSFPFHCPRFFLNYHGCIIFTSACVWNINHDCICAVQFISVFWCL